jgi:hypothetical protein
MESRACSRTASSARHRRGSNDPHRHTQAAYEALAAALPLGNGGYEAARTEKGERWIWLEERWLDKLKAMRGPDESYRDVIVRICYGRGRPTKCKRTKGNTESARGRDVLLSQPLLDLHEARPVGRGQQGRDRAIVAHDEIDKC